MNTWDAEALIPGQTLRVKPSRMADYGMTDQYVTFIALRERDGYKKPFIVAKDSLGQVGFYKLEDFAYHAPKLPTIPGALSDEPLKPNSIL